MSTIFLHKEHILEASNFSQHEKEINYIVDKIYNACENGAVIKVEYSLDKKLDNPKTKYYLANKDYLFEIFESLDIKNGVDFSLKTSDEDSIPDELIADIYGSQYAIGGNLYFHTSRVTYRFLSKSDFKELDLHQSMLSNLDTFNNLCKYKFENTKEKIRY